MDLWFLILLGIGIIILIYLLKRKAVINSFTFKIANTIYLLTQNKHTQKHKILKIYHNEIIRDIKGYKPLNINGKDFILFSSSNPFRTKKFYLIEKNKIKADIDYYVDFSKEDYDNLLFSEYVFYFSSSNKNYLISFIQEIETLLKIHQRINLNDIINKYQSRSLDIEIEKTLNPFK